MDKRLQELKETYPIIIHENPTWIDTTEYVISEQGQKGSIVVSDNVDTCIEAVQQEFDKK